MIKKKAVMKSHLNQLRHNMLLLHKSQEVARSMLIQIRQMLTKQRQKVNAAVLLLLPGVSGPRPF